MSLLTRLQPPVEITEVVKKFNPNHGADGRFSSGSGGGGKSISPTDGDGSVAGTGGGSATSDTPTPAKPGERGGGTDRYPSLHTQEGKHGTYHVENHGAGMHSIQFTAKRARKPQQVAFVRAENISAAMPGVRKAIAAHEATKEPGYVNPLSRPGVHQVTGSTASTSLTPATNEHITPEARANVRALMSQLAATPMGYTPPPALAARGPAPRKSHAEVFSAYEAARKKINEISVDGAPKISKAKENRLYKEFFAAEDALKKYSDPFTR